MAIRNLLANRRRALPAILLTVLTGALAGGEAGGTSPRHAVADSSSMAELWSEPTDLASRDLYWGPGGKDLAPRSDIDYRFDNLDKTGHSPAYEVVDPQGRKWKVKIGEEAQSEVVVSRILWAIGYHQPALYYLPAWRLVGGPTPTPPPGRFRLESDHKKEGQWAWRENPFVGTRQLEGLIVANLLLANWDLTTDNNRIYRVKERPGGESAKSAAIWYVDQDVGGSLGSIDFPIGSRNRLEDFEKQGFVQSVSGGHVTFVFPSLHANLWKAMTPADVAWACGWLARLSEGQLADAFRAAGYSDDASARYRQKIRQRIRQGLDLETAAGASR